MTRNSTSIHAWKISETWYLVKKNADSQSVLVVGVKEYRLSKWFGPVQPVGTAQHGFLVVQRECICVDLHGQTQDMPYHSILVQYRYMIDTRGNTNTQIHRTGLHTKCIDTVKRMAPIKGPDIEIAYLDLAWFLNSPFRMQIGLQFSLTQPQDRDQL